MIEFITVKDPTVRVLKLARGEIDLLQGNLSQEDIRWLDKQQNINVDAEPGDVFTYIGFNLQDAATGNPDVRTAIAHAIDRQAIIAHVMRDRARPAGALLPPEHWAGNNTLNGIRYNPKKAKQMLAAAGYTIENPLQLTFKTSSDPLRIRLATIMQDQLKQVGIRMRIQSYDWGTFYGDIKNGRFQLYSLSWVGLKLPDIFRHVFHSDSTPPSGANRGRFDDPVTDSLIEQAEIATDPEQRRRIYFDLQHRLHDQLPYIPLWYEHNVVAYRQQLSGYRLASDGNYDAMMSVDKVER